MADFWIDIENSSGTVQGDGPVTSALSWRQVRRLDRVGSFAFECFANDPRAADIQVKRIARCYTILDDTVTAVGAGIIERIAYTTRDSQIVMEVSGPDLMAELRYILLADGSYTLDYSNDDGIPYNVITDFANAKLSNAWTLADSGGTSISSDATAVTTREIYAQFRDETALGALVLIAEKAGDHFRLGTSDRTLEWINGTGDMSASGVRAVLQPPNVISPGDGVGVCLIDEIAEIEDSEGLANRIVLYGAGTGDTRLNLDAADEWPDGTSIGGNFVAATIDGYGVTISKQNTTGSALDSVTNCYQFNSSESTYGPIEKRIVFKDIAPISNTAADITDAANQLLRAGHEYLIRHSSPVTHYELSVTALDQVLRPGTTIDVYARQWVDSVSIFDVDASFYIMEATDEIDATNGLRTVALQVADTDRYPKSGNSAIVDLATESMVYEGHPQYTPNTWVESFRGVLDDTTGATFDFWLGDEIAQIQSAIFLFQVEELESTAVSNASESTHTHTVPDHQHDIVVGYSSSATTFPDLHLNDSSNTFVHNASGAAPITVVTDASSGQTTSQAGSSHTHGITYGVYQEASANTYGHSGGSSTLAQIKTDLDFVVAGSDRSASITSTGVSGWYELDITSWIIDSTTNRPSATHNTIAISKDSGASSGKTALIIGKLQLRTIVQSIKYS